MPITVYVDRDIVDRAVEAALSPPRMLRRDFFHEFRKATKEQLGQLFTQQGLEARTEVDVIGLNYLRSGTAYPLDPIVKYTGSRQNTKNVLDLEFCAGYGHDDYSLKAINYLDNGLSDLPSLLPFERAEPFSLGNILIPVENIDRDIRIEFAAGIYATGYSHDISKRKRKSYVCVFGLWFSRDVLKAVVDRFKRSDHQIIDDLDEIRIDSISYPIIFIDRKTGQLHTCSCFADHFDLDFDIMRFLPYGNGESEVKKALQELKVTTKLCHLCTGDVPRHEYGSSMYYSSFLQRYLPYHTLLWKKMGSTMGTGQTVARQLENQLREQLDYPRIGEKWLSETLLFKIVQTLFAGTKVVHHYRGAELDGLELDIWLPELRLGIEYQGEQHFEVVEHWGAKAGLSKRIENDRKKRDICKIVGYDLVEFRYDENLTEDNIAQILRKYMQRSRKE